MPKWPSQRGRSASGCRTLTTTAPTYCANGREPAMQTRRILSVTVATMLAAFTLAAAAEAQQARPNILVIFGDDIGMWNVGAYTHGMMGKTPNIDRIASEGILFTDHYGQPSCTAGRAAFIMGQLPVRTGMTTVGIPGSTRGIQKTDPTASSHWGTPPPSSARTISATATSSCRRCTASTSGSAISIT